MSLRPWSCLKLIESWSIHQMELVQVFRKYVRETQLLAKNDLSADFVKNTMFEVLFVRLNIEFSAKNELKSAYFQVSDILPNYMVTIFKPDLRVKD